MPKFRPTDNVELPMRASKYDDLIDAVSRMRFGTWIEVDVPKDTTTEAYRACVRQALNRYLPDDVRERKRYVVRNLPNGKVGINCLRADA